MLRPTTILATLLVAVHGTNVSTSCGDLRAAHRAAQCCGTQTLDAPVSVALHGVYPSTLYTANARHVRTLFSAKNLTDMDLTGVEITVGEDMLSSEKFDYTHMPAKDGTGRLDGMKWHWFAFFQAVTGCTVIPAHVTGAQVAVPSSDGTPSPIVRKRDGSEGAHVDMASWWVGYDWRRALTSSDGATVVSGTDDWPNLGTEYNSNPGTPPTQIMHFWGSSATIAEMTTLNLTPEGDGNTADSFDNVRTLLQNGFKYIGDVRIAPTSNAYQLLKDEFPNGFVDLQDKSKFEIIDTVLSTPKGFYKDKASEPSIKQMITVGDANYKPDLTRSATGMYVTSASTSFINPNHPQAQAIKRAVDILASMGDNYVTYMSFTYNSPDKSLTLDQDLVLGKPLSVATVSPYTFADVGVWYFVDSSFTVSDSRVAYYPNRFVIDYATTTLPYIKVAA